MSDNNYEDICYMCRRPESIAGKMMHIPGNICICNDCMQKTFDMMGKNGIPGLGSFPGMTFPGGGAAKGQEEPEKEPEKKDPEKLSGEVVSSDKPEGDDKEKDQDKDKNSEKRTIPTFFSLPFGFGGDVPQSQRVKKKKKDRDKPLNKDVLELEKLPAPHQIKAMLDEYVVGQEQAKKVMSVAVYNHYKRVRKEAMDSIEIDKSNMLMIGPTGCGKTYLVKTLARILNVPLAITDATSLTEAGYIGDDVESVLSKLLKAADNDVDRAEHGIVFIDEIDKIAKKKNTTSRDVSGESVQQALLKLLEGSEVEVPVGATSKNSMVPLTTMDTTNILFICGGAFPGLDDIIKKRLNKQASVGFNAKLLDSFEDDPDLLLKVQLEDLREFGMIPEFLGRLPVVYALSTLTKDMLIKIMCEPKNAILKQYEKLLELDEVKLLFDRGAMEVIAEKALEKKTGARALRAIIEEFMLDIMYEIPKDDNIGTVTITREYIEGTGGPVIELRGQA